MKASDTILDESGKLGCSLVGKLPYKDYKAVIDEACLHQAEISFKAGIKEAVVECLGDMAYDQIKQDGIKEVVEWGEVECRHDIQELAESGLCEYKREKPEKRRECPLCWQEFLKSEGIK